MANSASSFWGPPSGINSKDYQLLMSYANPAKYPYALDSHTLDAPTQNLTDSVTFTRTVKKNGRMKTVTTVSRAAEETSLDIVLGFPAGAIWSPALQLAKAGGCERDFFLRYLCGADCYDHFLVLPSARLDAPTISTSLLTVEDTVVIAWQTTLHAEEMLTYFHLDSYQQLTYSGWSFLTIGLAPEDCQDCNLCVQRRFIGGINDEVTPGPGILRTDDSGANWTDLSATLVTTGVTAGYFVSDIAANGNYVVAGLRDTNDPLTATAGEAIYSTDGGVNWTLFAGYTEGVNKVIFFNGVVHLIGTTGSVYYSEDGVNLIEVQNNVSAVTLTDASVDESNGVMYISGALNGGLGTALVYDGTALVDISSSVNSLVALLSVHVYDDNFIAFGGTGGFYTESIDGANNWCTVTLAGTTSAVNDINGDRYRHLVAAGSTLYERSILTNMLFEARPPRYSVSVTGNIMDIEAGQDHNDYHWVALGPDGQYFQHKSCAPSICESPYAC